ncbi:LysR family transcriptional regulator [Actinoplanes sp. CA-054009]
MDLIGACRVFVHVGERSSFTLGAAAAGVPQPVASRRIAALEKRFGEPLFDRTARRAVLTAFGRDMLAPAKRLVQMADSLDDDVAKAKLRPLTLAMPEVCPVRRLALLAAAARERGTLLDLRPAGPAARAELLRAGEVRAAILAVPPDEATWVAPLGVASSATDTNMAPPATDTKVAPAATDNRASPAAADTKAAPPAARPEPLHIDSLRPRRGDRAARRVWIQPEDDVAHIRDRLVRLGHRAALAPTQFAVAPTLTAALSEVLGSDDLLLCPAEQAYELELRWRPLAGDPVARGYKISATAGTDADRLRGELRSPLAHCLSAPAPPRPDPMAGPR